MKYGAIILASALLSSCAQVETKTELVTPSVGAVQTAGPGDTVLEFRSRRSLPNAFGKADLFGRTTNAGRTTVRYLGTRGKRAVFERSHIVVESDATTLTESPMIIPQQTNTSVYGSVGNVPVSGSATSTSYRYIPPRGSSEYVTASQPIQIQLGSGESVRVEGRTLSVVRVSPASVSYRIE